MADELKFENTLERLLAEAATSASARPRFYRELLESQILVVPHGAIEENDDPTQNTSTLRMAAVTHEGVNYTPFFLAEKFLPPGERYVSLPARTFFEITKGSHLVLNPGASCGKTFHPIEVEKMLSGALLQAEKEFELKSNAKVIIGAPKEVPANLLSELSKFFTTEPTVLRAWLGWYHNPEDEKEPGYLLAIGTTRSVDFRSLAGRVTLVLREVGTNRHYCDVVQFDGQGITKYFKTAQPFYQKPLWIRLKAGLLD